MTLKITTVVVYWLILATCQVSVFADQSDTLPVSPISSYLDLVANTVKGHWNPPYTIGTACDVVFRIQRDGSVLGGHLEISSGDAIFDRLALRTLASSVFPAFPKSLAADSLDIQLTFHSRNVISKAGPTIESSLKDSSNDKEVLKSTVAGSIDSDPQLFDEVADIIERLYVTRDGHPIHLDRMHRPSISTLISQLDGHCRFDRLVDVHASTETPQTPFLKSSVSPNGIGYMYLGRFSENTTGTIIDTYHSMLNQGMKGLLIDLRKNVGGPLPVVSETTAYFLHRKAIIGYLVPMPGYSQTELHAPDEGHSEVPIVILVDHSTASGGELFASALQKNDRAKVIGQTTAGLGAIHTLIPIRHEYILQVTTAYLYDAMKQPLERFGVYPDIIIGDSDANKYIFELPGSGETISFDQLRDDKMLGKAIDYLQWILKNGKETPVPAGPVNWYQPVS